MIVQFFLIALIFETIKTCNISQCTNCSTDIDSCIQCNQGYALAQLSDLECLSCSQICQDCGNGICTTCISSYYKLNSICYQCPTNCNCLDDNGCVSCSSSSYFVISNTCQLCDDNCATCVQSSTQCISCRLGMYLSNYQCIICPIGCSQCNSSILCTQCQDSYYLYNGICNKCSSNCLTCSSSSTYCLSCQSLETYPNSEGQCVSCSNFDANCTYCQGNGQCTTCVSGYFIQENYLSNSYVANCQKCSSQCSTCQNDSNECQTCSDDTYQPPFCSDCTSTQYRNGLICEQCDQKCLSCSNSSSLCTTCSQNRINPPTCQCDISYYDIGNGTCEQCSENCQYCQNNTICLTCILPYHLENNLCVNSCSDNHYLINNQCIQCEIENCQQCNRKNQCSSCESNYLLYQNSCIVAPCPEGQYLLNNNQCDYCNIECKNCLTTSNYCIQCNSESYLYNNTCIRECPHHYYNYNGICQQCDDSCKDCKVQSTQCQSCNIGTYLYLNQCISSCVEQFYGIDNLCKECPSNCLTCFNEDCLSCTLNYNLNNGICSSLCNDGYYNLNGVCQQCNPICNTCNNSTSCLTCQNPFYFYSGWCFGTCPTGYFGLSNKCIQCMTGCSFCLESSFCYKCSDGFAHFENSCVTQCDTGYYNEAQYCTKCHSYCLTCNGPTEYDCVECRNGLYSYKSRCIETCPSATVQIQGQCLPCFDSCLTCTNSGQGNCLTCKDNYTFMNGGCYAFCPSLYYKANGQCKQCLSNCYECLNGNECITCKQNYFRYEKNQCITSCPIGYYGLEGLCDECHFTCETCEGRYANNCLSCSNNLILFNNQCLSECPNTYYFSNNTCKSCQQNCSICSASTSCSWCSYGYYLKNGLCVQDCQDNYYLDNRQCIKCDQICDICLNGSQCITCAQGYIFYENYCYKTCPNGTYNNNNTICSLCNSILSNCNQCSSDGQTCLSCSSNYYLYNNNCILQCPDGFYGEVQQCVSCSENCKTCTNSSICTKCYNKFNGGQQNYYLQNDICVETCQNFSDGFNCTDICPRVTNDVANNVSICSSCGITYLYQDTCQQCENSCLTCFGSTSSQCLSCSQYIYNYTCYPSCPQGTYLLNQQCLTCHKNCQTCIGPNIDQCSTCYNNAYRYQNQCVNLCPQGYYTDSNLICQQCSSNCNNCFNYSQCTQCLNTQQLYNNECVSNCPNGYYAFNNLCLQCKASCVTCQNGNDCITTYSTYGYVQNGAIVIICSQGYYLNGSTCYQCMNSCKTCSNQTTCDSCDEENYFLENNICVSFCSSGNYFDGSQCSPCYTGCNTCTDSGSLSCLSCSSSKNFIVLYDKGVYSFYCQSGCGGDYTSYNNVCIYKTCDSTCATCLYSTSDYCYTCNSGYTLKYTIISHIKAQYGNCLLATSTACGNGYFIKNQICTECDVSCLTCINSSTNCLSCTQSYFMYNSTCILQCPYHYAQRLSDMTCQECQEENCLECIYTTANVYKCTVYKNTCQTNQYMINGSCQNCHYSCQTCNGPTEYDCTDCSNVYNNQGIQEYRYQYYNQCLLFCPVGTYLNGSKCNLCNTSCEQCTSSTICTSCYIGYYLLNNNCLSSCGNNYYQNLITQKCESCFNGCIQCFGVNYDQCLSCSNNYLLQETTCLPYCPFQMYYDLDQRKCLLCEYYIYNNSCLTQCPIGYQSKDNLCQVCTNNCTSCVYNNVLKNNQCFTNCGNGYYSNSNNICNICNEKCLTCESTSDNCLQCANTTRSPIPKCQCSNGYQEDSSSLQCILCNVKCTRCIIEPDNCIACSNERVNNPPFCTCPLNTYTQDNQCLQCPFACIDCINESYCISCKGDRIGTQCNCPLGKYDDNISQQCQICDKRCKTCTNQGCTDCVDGRTLYGNSCICSLVGYYDDLNTYECMECDFKCQTCTATGCTKCRGNRSTSLCVCSDGYFDDEVNDLCQTCPKECVTCNKSSCLICKTNRQGSICGCPQGGTDRQLVGYMYCETCELGLPIIQMQEDLVTLIITFGKQVKIGNSCQQLLPDQLGIGVECSINSEYQIVVKLGTYNTIYIGQTVQLSTLAGIQAIECSEPYSTISETIILSPQIISSSDVIIYGPEQISVCDSTQIYVAYYLFDGNNKFQMINWQSDSTNSKLQGILIETNYYLQTTLNIPPYILEENVTYQFQYEFLNYAKEKQSKQFQLQVLSQTLPKISILNYDQQPLIKWLNNIISINVELLQQSCNITNQTNIITISEIYYKWMVYDNDDNLLLNQEYISNNQQRVITIIIPAYTFNEGYNYVIIQASFNKIDTIQQTINFKILKPQLTVDIIGNNHIHYFKTTLNLTAQVQYDTADTYEWTCVDYLQEKCYQLDGSILTFTTTNQQLIDNLIPYNTYLFKVTAYNSQSDVSAETQSIIQVVEDVLVTSFQLDKPNNGLLFTQDIPVKLHYEYSDQISIMGQLISNFSLLSFINIPYTQFQLEVYNQIDEFINSITLRVILNDPINPYIQIANSVFNFVQPPLNCEMNISPEFGISFTTEFTIQINGCVDLNYPLTYKFEFSQNDSYNLLLDYSTQNSLKTLLQENSTVIVTIRNQLGAITKLSTFINIDTTDNTLEQLISLFNETSENSNRLSLLFLFGNAISQLSISEEQNLLRIEIFSELQTYLTQLISDQTKSQIYNCMATLFKFIEDQTNINEIIEQIILDSINATQTRLDYINNNYASYIEYQQNQLELKNLYQIIIILDQIIQDCTNSECLHNVTNNINLLKYAVWLLKSANQNQFSYYGSSLQIKIGVFSTQKMLSSIEIFDNDLALQIFNFSSLNYSRNPYELDDVFMNNTFNTSLQFIEPLYQNGNLYASKQSIITNFNLKLIGQRLLQEYQDLYLLEIYPYQVQYQCVNYIDDYWDYSDCNAILLSELIVQCVCNNLGQTTIITSLKQLIIQDKFQKQIFSEQLKKTFDFNYGKSVIVYVLPIAAFIIILLLPYGYYKDSVEKEHSIPDHQIESEYIRKQFEDQKALENSEFWKLKEKQLQEWMQFDQNCPQIIKTPSYNLIQTNEQIQKIIPDVDPDAIIGEEKDDFSFAQLSQDSQSEDKIEQYYKKRPKRQLSTLSKYFNYKNFLTTDSNTVVTRVQPSLQYILSDHSIQPFCAEQKQIEDIQSQRQEQPAFASKTPKMLTQLQSSINSQGRILHDQEANIQLSPNKVDDIQENSMVQENCGIQRSSTTDNKKENDIYYFREEFNEFDDDQLSTWQKEEIILKWQLQQKMQKLQQQSVTLDYTLKNVFGFIVWFQDILTIFYVFDKRLSRPFRFCILYTSILITYYLFIYFKVSLNPSNTIGYGVFLSIIALSLIEIFIYFMRHNYLIIRIIWQLGYVALTAILIYLIVDAINDEANSTSNVSPSNEWGINFLISFLMTHFIFSPIKLALVFKIIQWSYKNSERLFIELGVHYNIYFEQFDQ